MFVFVKRLPYLCIVDKETYEKQKAFAGEKKPSMNRRMEACARGQLLILAPWEHHNEHIAISRNQCLSLNDMARMICNQSV